MTFERSMAIVIGPTPPGTGVISAISAMFSVSQSQESFLHPSVSSTLIPTSITRDPGRIMSAVMRCFLPTADMTISAFLV